MTIEHRENGFVTVAISLNAIATQFDALHWGDFGTCVQEKANRFDVSAAYGVKQGSKPTFSSTVHVRASIN
jgi:hypothetical protein